MKSLISYVLASMCIGSFIYLIILVTYGPVENVQVERIYSVWVASAAIGAATIVHHFNWASLARYAVQFGVGIAAFTIVNIYHGWLEISFLEILNFGLSIFLIMLLISAVNYLLSARDSKLINQILNKK
ncbi:DUF3021 family protein [Salinicoccus hispanicus]|uniref:DUF3021 family protein n=1 Tax=Salinicoccus hispanicus TaxID=157225 RepID=A0A6N8U1L9_9STAP|nr:DUF3021 family protein [Salinicoccus hispanicus]MXQ51623.1 DUF3021 family protein [Salinicoccus hispanicus]